MERVSEPTVKSEKDSVWADTESKEKATCSNEKPPGNIIYIKDSLHVKDEPEKISDCIKKEIKDEMEVGFEEWEESETGERGYLPGCLEGNLTEVSQIPSTRKRMHKVFQKVKVGTQDDAEFNDGDLEAGLDAAEGKTVKLEEEEWCQVESSHISSVELKYERIFRKKFGCAKDPAIRLGRLNPDTTVPVQWINSERKLEHINEETAKLDSIAKSHPQGPNRAEDPGSHLNKGGATELEDSFSLRNIFDQLSVKAFDKSYPNQHSPISSKETQCSYNHCSYVINNKDDLNISCITQNIEKKFACDQCPFTTNSKPYLRQHHLSHSKEKKFACDHCSYKTNYRSSLNMHCLNHSSIKKFACDQCSYKTNDKSLLTQHCLNHINVKKFACDQCSYKTNRKNHLNKHCLNHSNIRKFACDQCSYKTNNKSHLTYHCLNHSDIKMFACDHCSYKTNSKSYFTQHCLNHSNLKNLACGQCSYKTNIKGNLTKHCLSHRKFKRFACDQCLYTTNHKSHLTRHCLTHSHSRENFSIASGV